jgi:hypothetical protein
MLTRIVKFSSVLLLASSLVGCGEDQVAVLPGGGGSGTVPPINLTAFGPLQSSNPLLLNDITFISTDTAIAIADADDAGRGPQPGMVARLASTSVGQLGQYRANSLAVNAELRGAVTRAATTGAGFAVMGVDVIVNDQTIIDLSAQPLQPNLGDLLQVHGLPTVVGADRRSAIIATRISRRSNDNVFKFVGEVSYAPCPTCASAQPALSVGGLQVNVAPTATPGQRLALPAGSLVRVVAAAAPTMGRVDATKIESYAPQLVAGDTVSMRGAVSRKSGDSFIVNGVTAALAPSTQIVGGTLADIVIGKYVQLDGKYSGDAISVQTLRVLP